MQNDHTHQIVDKRNGKVLATGRFTTEDLRWHFEMFMDDCMIPDRDWHHYEIKEIEDA